MNGITYLNSDVGEVSVNISSTVEMTDGFVVAKPPCRKRLPAS